MTDATRFRAAFDPLAAIGWNPITGGFNRFAWTRDDRAARDWFRANAIACGAGHFEQDRNGNSWAWFGDHTAPDVVATGSHLDTVPEGGAYDGALGVVGGLIAGETLRRSGAIPAGKALAVVAFADEEGARFGTACVGSRLMTGALEPDRARQLRDGDGIGFVEAVTPFGVDAGAIGPDRERVSRLRAFVELHIEQGRQLDTLDVGVAAASGIWPHGRWRLTVDGEANHAGTTMAADRRDPMPVLATAIDTASRLTKAGPGLATVGRVVVEPNGTNVIPSRVSAWLDARAPDDAALDAMVAEFRAALDAGVEFAQESRTPAVSFDEALRARLGVATTIATGAGHDAGILAAALPTAMLFVRNPSGVSHSPAERATDDDCVAGIAALATALANLLA